MPARAQGLAMVRDGGETEAMGASAHCARHYGAPPHRDDAPSIGRAQMVVRQARRIAKLAA